MEGMLTSRSYALNGVLNGVDLVEWDPENDPHIYQNYGESNLAEGKKANKAGLQKEMGLPQRPEVYSSANVPSRRACGQLNSELGLALQLHVVLIMWQVKYGVPTLCRAST